jgi:hypothetical protein
MNCDALFQTALLLTADVETAEGSLTAALEYVDVSRPPEENEFATVHKALVLEAIHKTAAIPLSGSQGHTR